MTEALAILSARDLKRLENNHAALLKLCLDLEDAADDLESGFDGGKCHHLSRTVLPLIKETQELEETILFPDFERHAGSCFSAMMIERLKAEHRCDKLAAQELTLTLVAYAQGRCRLSLETIGYMLRGFLECLRRHISSETLMIEALLAAEIEGRQVLA